MKTLNQKSIALLIFLEIVKYNFLLTINFFKLFKNKWYLYYGTADSKIAVASSAVK